MKFEKITIQNFLSIKSITMELDKQGLLLIKGVNKDNPMLNANGAGKSSIFDAIIYVLYARTTRGLNGDEVVNNKVKKNCKIFLDLVDDDGTKYRIARYRKHNVNKNHSFIYMNGKDVTPKSEQDINQYIVDLLCMDYDTFTSTLLYSQSSFNFTNSTDAQMKQAFDTMLNLEVFTKCQEITKSRLKEIESEVSNTEWKIDSKMEQITRLENEIEENKLNADNFFKELQEKSEELGIKLQELYKSVEDSTKEIENYADEIQENNDLLESLNNKLKGYEETSGQITELKQVVDETETSISKYKREIRNIIGEITDTEEQIERNRNRMTQCETKIIKYDKEMKELDDTIGTPCPTCGKPLTADCLEDAKHEYQSKIKDAEDMITEYQNKITDAEESIKSNQSKKTEVEELISTAENELETYNELLTKVSKVTTKIDKLKNQILSIEKDNVHLKSDKKVAVKSIENVKFTISEFEKQIEDLDKTVNPYDEIVNSKIDEKATINAEITEMKDSIKDKLDMKEMLKFWETAYSNKGIKSFMLDSITPFLNKRANKYLQKLASDNVEIKFSTQTTLKDGSKREKFSIEVVNKDGGASYQSNSSGEKKRIDLAVQLALQDLVASRGNKKINIVFYDEVFDALDSMGIENVCSLLQDISKEKSSVFVISHNDDLKNNFENSITVVKEDGKSTLQDYDEDAEEDED